MNPSEQREFYIGYLSQAPRGIRRWMRAAVIALLSLVVLVALWLVWGQQKFAASRFEFGAVREFSGVIQASPYPVLLVGTGADKSAVRYTLVAPGKHGADALVSPFAGQSVRLRGTLIYRDDLQMIEVEPDSLQPAQLDGRLPAAPETLGSLTLFGEIVDSKCYLGVMNPGHTKPHRECAANCIRGGIPPLFVVRDGDGKSAVLWLTGAQGEGFQGEALRQLLDVVAEPVSITGEVSRVDGQLFLRAAPASIRRIP